MLHTFYDVFILLLGYVSYDNRIVYLLWLVLLYANIDIYDIKTLQKSHYMIKSLTM